VYVVLYDAGLKLK